jgi:hypothetical protein
LDILAIFAGRLKSPFLNIPFCSEDLSLYLFREAGEDCG